jgi:hypothetical protein
VFLITVLLFAGGIFAGLTIGYISIDHLELELKLRNGTEVEYKINIIRRKKKLLQ